MKLRGRRVIFGLIGATVAIVSLSTPTAAAGASQPASGGIHDNPATFKVITQRTADGNTIQTATVEGVIDGTFVGTLVEPARVVSHATGEGNLKGRATCYCSLGNRSGTFVFGFNASAEPDGSLTAHWTIMAATGGLAGLTGQGVISSPDGVNGFYSGQIRL